ncbi:MAG: O-antigen ligase family protein [Thermoleophilia bacterium]
MLYFTETIASSNREKDGPAGEKSHLFRMALTAFIIVIAGTLLYPDTFTRAGLRVGPFRISALALLFFIVAPPVFAFAWSRRGSLKPGIVDVALLLMVGFMVIRGFAAATNGNELGLDAAFAVYTLLLYYGASILGQHSPAFRVITLTLAILALIISLYAILEFILNDNFIYGALIEEKVPIKSAELHRSGSTLAHPAVLGVILIALAPLQIYFFYREKNIFRRTFWGVSLLISVVALYVSFSKGSWITAAIIFLATSIILIFNLQKIYGKLKPFVILTTALIFILLLFVSLSYKEFEFNVFSSERRFESFGMRWVMWEKAPGVFFDNHMIGVGMWKGAAAVYSVVYNEGEQDAKDAGYEENMIPVDNLYLTTMVEEGLIGTLLLILTISLIGRQAWSLIRTKGRQAGMVISLSVGMVAVLINGMTMDTLLIFPIMFIFWLYAGLIRAKAEGAGQIGDPF